MSSPPSVPMSVPIGSSASSPSLTTLNSGTQEWRLHGRLHRLDGPAFLRADGTQAWYAHGKHHRVTGPAITCSDGSHMWYIDGKRHRLDGPASLSSTGIQKWYAEDRIHRLDGPAVIHPDGTEEWWIHGYNITSVSAHQKMEYIRTYLATREQASPNAACAVVNTDT